MPSGHQVSLAIVGSLICLFAQNSGAQVPKPECDKLNPAASLPTLRACLDLVGASKQAESDDRYYADRWTNLILSGARFEGRAAYTGNEATTGGPGTTTPVEIDDHSIAYARAGFVDKKVLRDLYFLGPYFAPDSGAALANMKAYREREWWRRAIVDPFTISAYVQYGTQIKNPEGDDNFKTETGWQTYIGLQYVLPLDSAVNAAPFKE